jgi:hypothetical protein
VDLIHEALVFGDRHASMLRWVGHTRKKKNAERCLDKCTESFQRYGCQLAQADSTVRCEPFRRSRGRRLVRTGIPYRETLVPNHPQLSGCFGIVFFRSRR